ncbi:PQQ-binding-like beta-propeller repeat protein [Streptacidiphilus sp. EB103A]|uniref:outer membrane protein assembly factor BamB family protein n=1 Tax=Streptacidiphilus sp. EB103A TaxID=3156275 RepID=UPI00351859F1
MARSRAGFLVPLCAAALLVGTAACGGSGPVAAPAPAPLTLTPGSRHPNPSLPGDWTTYHHDAARSGSVTGLPQAGPVRKAWSTVLDGAVYAQPLVVRGTVVAATENDTLYGLSGTDGHILWQRHIGTPARLDELPCGNIDPLGITGTPVYEPTTGLVFAVAELSGGRHVLVGVDPATGALLSRREVEPPRGDPRAHQQRGALAAVDGRVLIAYGGLYGDCGDYTGGVVSVPAEGSGPVRDYTVPTGREGGIWATGGPVVTGSGGTARIFVSVGNGASSTGYDGSDSVLDLTPALTRADWFAPATWADDNSRDLDLGSMTPAVVGRFVLIVGKRGTGFVLDSTRLGGDGGQLSQAPVCSAYGTAAVLGSSAFVPCDRALARVDIGPDGALRTAWRIPLGAAGSPAVGGGAVWVVDYASGTLHALDPATGRSLAEAPTGPVPHFAAPVLSGSRVLLGTGNGVTAFSGG